MSETFLIKRVKALRRAIVIQFYTFDVPACFNFKAKERLHFKTFACSFTKFTYLIGRRCKM